MLKRSVEDKVYSKLKTNKAVLIFGARRVGKTVLIKQIIKKFQGKYLLLNGEDFDSLSLLEPRSIANYRRLLNGIELLATGWTKHTVSSIPFQPGRVSGSFSKLKFLRIPLNGFIVEM